VRSRTLYDGTINKLNNSALLAQTLHRHPAAGRDPCQNIGLIASW